MSETPYNPLDKLNLGKSVADALLEKHVLSLADRAQVIGAGVYAIYYTGSFRPYAPLTKANRGKEFKKPIYVGKAIPKGGRKGGIREDASAIGRALRDRLSQHANSISEARNLDINDFHYRCLVVDDIWIPLGENVLIEQFRPIWNMVIDGFGNKTPGRRRATQYRSSWDTIHPGRRFVDDLGLAVGPVTKEELFEKIDAFFAGRLDPKEPVDTGDED